MIITIESTYFFSDVNGNLQGDGGPSSLAGKSDGLNDNVSFHLKEITH
jgi:hypothetical protein